MKIVVFTGDENQGGIMQFTLTIVRSFQQMGHDTVLMLPDINKVEMPEDIRNSYRYKKKDHVLPRNRTAERIGIKIKEQNPDFIFFTDSSIIAIQVLKYLKQSFYTCMTIHDITRHPMHIKLNNIKRVMVLKLAEMYVGLGVKCARMVVVLSQNSLTKYCKEYHDYIEKAMMFKLGAHPPIAEPKIPNELVDHKTGFILFFGRIEKYKGILQLVKAYNAISSHNNIPELVIAGAGELLIEEKELINQNSNIILINRFISDSELVWLFQKSSVLTAPYIEASQSGVIPLAYYYGKPVIASNIAGIRENVSDGKTGALFDTEAELTNLLINFSSWNLNDYRKRCIDYLNSEMNWESNLQRLVERVTCERRDY